MCTDELTRSDYDRTDADSLETLEADDADQRLPAARAFWLDEQATDDQIQAVLLIAQQKKFRPKSVLALDDERKARHLASLASLPDALAARALIVYHLAEQRDDDGRVSRRARHRARERPHPGRRRRSPTPAKIGAGGRRDRRRSFRADDVSLYLDTLLCQDPETWGALRRTCRSWTGSSASVP